MGVKTMLVRMRDILVEPLKAPLDRMENAAARSRLANVAAAERYADPRCLTRRGYRCFSQFDEDGLIDEIFRRIGSTNRTFVEFGVGDGLENNTVALLLAGWRGLWIEADPVLQERIRSGFTDALESGQLTLTGEFVTAENIEELLARGRMPEEPDLASIDIDGNDYWVWKAMRRFRPRVVVIEYNASLGRTARIVRPYDPSACWDGTTGAGASLAALEALGREKGYALVGCSIAGVNALFVRSDLVGAHFLEPFTSEVHFEPPRFGCPHAGHPPRWARFDPA
jgi:hypothetical protein